MKVRDSGMPDEKVWNDFFDTALILSELQIDSQINDMIDSKKFIITKSTFILEPYHYGLIILKL